MILWRTKIFLLLLCFSMNCLSDLIHPIDRFVRPFARNDSDAIYPIDRIVSPSYDVEELKIISRQSFLNSDMVFVRDKSDVYLIKITHRVKPKAAIKEVVCSWIAREVGIAANEVRIIPARGALAAKLKLVAPATIHTLVPGRSIAGYSCPVCLKIRQTLKGGPNNRGLTYQVIHNMSVHQDLPRIAALDTFTGNHDRNNKNLFYDNVSDSFFAIDFGGTFRGNLAQIASVNIRRLIQDQRVLTRQEIYGLKRYCDTLNRLIGEVQSGEVMQRIGQLAYLVEGLDILELRDVQRVFLEGYASCHELITLLESFISKYTYHEKNQLVEPVDQLVSGQSQILALFDLEKPYEFATMIGKHKECRWCEEAYNSEALQDFDSEQKRSVVERMCAYWEALTLVN